VIAFAWITYPLIIIIVSPLIYDVFPVLGSETLMGGLLFTLAAALTQKIILFILHLILSLRVRCSQWQAHPHQQASQMIIWQRRIQRGAIELLYSTCWYPLRFWVTLAIIIAQLALQLVMGVILFFADKILTSLREATTSRYASNDVITSHPCVYEWKPKAPRVHFEDAVLE